MRAVELLTLCLLSSAKSDKSKDLRYDGKGNQASPDVYFDPSTGKFVNHQPIDLDRAGPRSQKNLNHKEAVLSNSLAESTTLDSKINPKDVYDSLSGFKNSPGPQGSHLVEYNHFNSPEDVMLDSKASKYPSYHFTIGGNGQESGSKDSPDNIKAKVPEKNKFYEEISFLEDHQSERKSVTPSGVVADKPSKRYQYDYTIGEDPNLAFKNHHPTEPISKKKFETTTPYSTTTTTTTTPITTKRSTTFQPKRLVKFPSRRQIITRRPIDTERSTTTSSSSSPKRSQSRPNAALLTRPTTTTASTTTSRTTTTTTITTTRRTTTRFPPTAAKTTTFLPYFSTEKPKFEIPDSVNFDDFNDENSSDQQTKSVLKNKRKLVLKENFDTLSNDRNEVISDVYPEDESAKFPHFPAKKNVATTYDEIYPADYYEDERDDLKPKKFTKQDNELLPSTDSFVRSSTAPPPNFEPLKPVKPVSRDSRIKLPVRPNSDTTTTKSPQQTVNLPSKIYHPDSGKLTTFRPHFQDYKNYDYDQSYEAEDQQKPQEPILNNQPINLPTQTSFNQNIQSLESSFERETSSSRFPSFQGNFPRDVKKPMNPPPQKSYYNQQTIQAQDHWFSQNNGDRSNLDKKRPELHRDVHPPEYDYSDDYYGPHKQIQHHHNVAGQLDFPRREFVDKFDDDSFRDNSKRKVPELSNYERPAYGSAKDTSYQSVTFPKAPKINLENNYQQEKFSEVSAFKGTKNLSAEKAAPFVYFGPNYPNQNQPAPLEIPLQDEAKILYEDSVLFQPAYKQKTTILESNLEQYPVLHDNPLLPPPMPGYSAPDLYGKDIPRSKRKQPSAQHKQPDYPVSFTNYQNNDQFAFAFAPPPTTTSRPSTLPTTRMALPLSNDQPIYPLNSSPPPPPPPVPYVSVRPYGEPAQLQVVREDRPEEFQPEPYRPEQYPESPTYQQQNKNLPPPPPPPTKPPPPPPPPSYTKELVASPTERTRFNAPYDTKNIPMKGVFVGGPFLQVDRQQLPPSLPRTGLGISMFHKRDGGFTSGEKRGSPVRSVGPGPHVSRKQSHFWPLQFRGKRQEGDDDEEVIDN